MDFTNVKKLGYTPGEVSISYSTNAVVMKFRDQVVDKPVVNETFSINTILTKRQLDEIKKSIVPLIIKFNENYVCAFRPIVKSYRKVKLKKQYKVLINAEYCMGMMK